MVAEADVRNRHLKEDAVAAAVALADVDGRVHRSILAELLRRGLLLAKVISKVRYISQKYTLARLLQEAALRLTDMRCTPEVLGRLGATQQELEEWRPHSWVEVAVRKEYSDLQTTLERMSKFLDYHRRLATVMEAHLKLTGQNILRTP